MSRGRQLLLLIAVAILFWASYLAFGFADDNHDLTEDAFGWGFLGLCLGMASFLEIHHLRNRR